MWQTLFPKKGWTEFILARGNPLELTQEQITPFLKALIDDCRVCVKTSQYHKLIDRMSLGCLVDKKDFLSRCKKEGWLRHSNYELNKNPIVKIAAHFIRHKKLFGLTLQELVYFESLVNLEGLAREMTVNLELIKRKMLRHKPRSRKIIEGKIVYTSIIKTLLAMNDEAFLNRQREDILETDEDLPVTKSFSIEQRSEAISFLLYLASDLIKIRKNDLFMIDDSFAKSEECKGLILSACEYRAFKEIEISIESSGFACMKVDDSFEITYPDEKAMKSKELSHIISYLQKQADKYELDEHFRDLVSLKDLAFELHKTSPGVVQLIHEPYSRFRLDTSAAFINYISTQPIGTFAEEYEALEYIQNELSLPLEDMEKYQIAGGLSLKDYMIINRLFFLMQEIYSEKLKDLTNEENELVVLNSLLPLLSEKDILAMFEQVLPAHIVKRWLEINSWQPGSKKFLDLQYTPVIQHEEFYLISLSVLRHSRMVRNIMASLPRSGENQKVKQMQLLKSEAARLSEVFEQQGFRCLSELKIYFKSPQQSEGDIDFLAYRDDYLFISECKDVNDSVDAFEIRRINDSFQKAASQLDYIKSAFTDEGYRKSLSERIGIDFPKY